MTDHLDKKKRSWNMSQIHSKDSLAEIKVRSALHAAGYRFRLHRKDLPGTPDIVLQKHRVAIFVHGCFWHRDEGCVKASTPKSNVSFWKKKLDENVQRDLKVKSLLIDLGWRVKVIWECQTFKSDKLVKAIEEFIIK